MCLWCACDVVSGVWCGVLWCVVVLLWWSVATLKRYIVTPAVLSALV